MKASVGVETAGPVWTITLDRPERRNAVDRATADALATAFRGFDAEPDAQVAVLTGVGGHFCAGADLVAAARGDVNRIEPEGDGPMGPTRLALSKPVIAAIEGYCVAGGLELALWCDLRVAAEGATFGVFCRRVGVPLIDGGTVRLPRLIGASRALDLILTGRPVSAEEALDFGLVNRVVPTGGALAAARALARELAAFPVECLRADLASTRAAFDGDVETCMQAELTRGRVAFERDGRGGAQRFARGAGRHGEPMSYGTGAPEPVKAPAQPEETEPEGTP